MNWVTESLGKLTGFQRIGIIWSLFFLVFAIIGYANLYEGDLSRRMSYESDQRRYKDAIAQYDIDKKKYDDAQRAITDSMKRNVAHSANQSGADIFGFASGTMATSSQSQAAKGRRTAADEIFSFNPDYTAEATAQPQAPRKKQVNSSFDGSALFGLNPDMSPRKKHQKNHGLATHLISGDRKNDDESDIFGPVLPHIPSPPLPKPAESSFLEYISSDQSEYGYFFIAFYWALYFSIRWIRDGFRKQPV